MSARHGPVTDRTCRQHLDTAYAHAQKLLLAHGNPAVSLHALGGGDASAEAWIRQAWQCGAAGDAPGTLAALRGWYARIAELVKQAQADPEPAALEKRA
jgi:hypothetical protein